MFNKENMKYIFTILSVIILTQISFGQIKDTYTEDERMSRWPDSISFEHIIFPDTFINRYVYETNNSSRIKQKTYWELHYNGIEKLREKMIIHKQAYTLLVYYYVDLNTYYLQFDCTMGHGDPSYGPFPGNPTEILRLRN